VFRLFLCEAIDHIRAGEQREKGVGILHLCGSSEVKRERHPPRQLEHVIEHVLAFAELRRLDFHARLFAVQPVKNADGEGEQCSSYELTGGE